MKGVVFTTDGKMFVKEFTQPLYKSVGDVVEGWIEVVHPRGLEDPFCRNLQECKEMLDQYVDIPDEKCIGCVLRWLQEVEP